MQFSLLARLFAVFIFIINWPAIRIPELYFCEDREGLELDLIPYVIVILKRDCGGYDLLSCRAEVL